MIKINLLPVPKARKVKKQAELRSQLILIVLALVMMGIFFSYTWFDLNKRLQQLQKTKIEATAKLDAVKKKVETVQNFEENKKILEEKNAIIEQLKKKQAGPIRVLDEISKNLEPLKLWLTGLSLEGNRVNLDGKAITNSEIVEFISNLKESPVFSGVALIESRQTLEGNIPVYQFTLQADLIL